MFKTIKNAWSIPDLRRKILFTLLIIVIFRIGSVIPVPFLNMDALAHVMNNAQGSGVDDTLVGYLNTLSGGAFSNATIFAMGITPYINSSIIMQLLCVAIPPLERLSKEGEEGRKKIAAITRYVTVGLGLIQGTAYFFFLKNTYDTQAPASGDWTPTNLPLAKYTSGFSMWFAAVVIILAFTAGTALIMWLGEQINKNGIGNGISILLFAGIVARLPYTVNLLGEYWKLGAQGSTQYYVLVPLFVVLFLAVIWFITFMQDAERRIPIQYAKRVVGRKMYGGQSTHLPIKVTLGGVMPIIFASSILSIPSTIQMFVQPKEGFWKSFLDAFSTRGWLYAVLYFVLILAFAYFYTTIQYNPIEMPTADFIAKILSRITLIGALFLSVIALLPILYSDITQMYGLSMGGTSVIIIVGVALDTAKQLESQMMMRHYKGFLD
nr:preprotein translocase subunit SecY [uncultured Ruminococcus sp.]